MLAFHYTRLASTNTTARTLAQRHPGRALLVSSQIQTAGRGRMGRPWISPPGGAWFTLAWPVCPALPATSYEAVPLVVGEAVLGVLDERLRPGAPGRAARLEIKWPNDLLLNGRKLAGILCERIMTSGAEASPSAETRLGETVLLIGVGINVNIKPEDLGSELRYPAASLLDVMGSPTPVGAIIAHCARRMTAALRHLEEAGFTPQHARQIEQLLAFRGQELAFCQGNRTVVGRCLGLDDAGRLLMQVGSATDCFSAGEISGLTAQEDSAVAF